MDLSEFFSRVIAAVTSPPTGQGKKQVARGVAASKYDAQLGSEAAAAAALNRQHRGVRL